MFLELLGSEESRKPSGRLSSATVRPHGNAGGDEKLSVSTLDNNINKSAVNAHEMIGIGVIIIVNAIVPLEVRLFCQPQEMIFVVLTNSLHEIVHSSNIF